MEDASHDRMATLISGVTAAQAEMIAEDLRDLQISAAAQETSRDCSAVLVPAEQQETAERILHQIWPERDRGNSTRP